MLLKLVFCHFVAFFPIIPALPQFFLILYSRRAQHQAVINKFFQDFHVPVFRGSLHLEVNVLSSSLITFSISYLLMPLFWYTLLYVLSSENVGDFLFDFIFIRNAPKYFVPVLFESFFQVIYLHYSESATFTINLILYTTT